MSYSQENGYVPETIEEIMDAIRLNINSEFSLSYTTETFLGTKWYKYFYALAQKLQENEIKTGEIFLKLQNFISITNEEIQRPSVSYPGAIESFKSRGYTASLKKMIDADAGKLYLCVDVDDTDPDYADIKLEIAGLIRDFFCAGLVYQGDQVQNLTLSNGQDFDFKYFLPDKTPVLLRLTLNVSDNNLFELPDDITIRQQLFDKINSNYRLGLDFEPQRYWNTTDSPWASDVLLEYSDDSGVTWESGIFQADYRDLLTFGLEDIEIIINL